MTNIYPDLRTEPFVANPHALLTDGVVTDVVFMQDYDEEQIKETLSKYSYDEVASWDEYGYMIYAGYIKIGKWIVTPQPTPNHTFNETNGAWELPRNAEYTCTPCESHKEKSVTNAN
jgi:hypothetical protein